MSRTVDFIIRKYWWKTLRSNVSEYIKRCNACAKGKTGHRVVAPLGDALVVHEFLNVVSLNIVEPLPVIEKGNECLRMVINYFTKFCDVISIVK